MGIVDGRVVAVAAVDVPSPLAGSATERLSAPGADLVRRGSEGAETTTLVATFTTVRDAMEAAAHLVLDPDGAGLRCGVLTLDRDPGPIDGHRGLAARAEELCRSAGSGQIVVAAVRPTEGGSGGAARATAATNGIAGRTAELRDLHDAMARAESGHAEVVTLAGALGSGRSTMLRHLGEVALSRRFSVVSVAGAESELGGRWSSLTAATLTAPDAERAARLADQLPSLSTEAAPEDRVVSAELLTYVATATDEHPLLVGIDDVDRVDEASRRALRSVAGRLGAERCLVVGTAPDDPAHWLAPEAIRLRDLADEPLARIIERDGPIDPMVLRRCVELAAGNPLAAREVSRSLSPRQRSGLDSLPSVPEPAAAVLAGFRELLASASEPARRAAVVAAADDTGESGVIRGALEELGESPDGLEEAEDAGLVRIDGTRVRFAHPMLRSVAYHQVAARSRRAAHRALGAALSQPRQAAARAFQLAAAAVGPNENASEALALVAESEARRGDLVAAARAISRAAQLTADDGLRDERLVRAAVWQLRAGAPSAAEAMLAELSAPVVNADALVARCLTDLARLGPARARTRLDQLEVAGDLRAVADALTAYLAGLAGEAPESSADPVAPLVAAVRVLSGVGAATAVRDAGDFSPGALGALEAGVAAAALIEGGWMREAKAAVRDLESSVAAVDPVAVQAAAGLLALESGRPVAALERLGDGDESQDGTTPGHCARLLALSSAQLHCGRLGDADESLRRATVIIDRLGLGLYEGEVDRLTGLVRHAQGRPEGLELLGRAHHKRSGRALADLALAALERGGTPSPDWKQRLRSLAGRPDPRAALGARRALAAMSHDVAGLGELAREQEDTGLVLEAVITRGARVSAARRAGQRSAALRGDVAELGRRYGITCPGARYWESATKSDPVAERLTKAEHRVAVAVGAGASNKSAAAELFVSTKTVDYHLQNIYRKLGIRSRTELAVLMAGTGGTEGGQDE